MRCSVAITTLLLTIVFYQGTKPSDHPAKPGDTDEKSKQEIKPLTPVPDSSHATVGKPNESSKQNGTANPDTGLPHWVNLLNATSTAVVALFTILVFFVYRAMLHATKMTERAWLVSDIGTIEETPTNQTHQVKVQIRNNGNTPAWVTAAGSNGWWVTDQNPLPRTPKYTLMQPFTKDGQLLPPTASFEQGFPLEKARIDRAVKKEVFLYVFGFVEYRDIYGNKHLTRYCYQAKPPLDLNHPQQLDFYIDGPDEYLKAT